MLGLLQGDLGYSFEYNLPVTEVVGDRLLLTFIVSFATIIFIYLVAFPIGVYSATHQYSCGDYGLTFLGFLGLATPNFLLALMPHVSRQRAVRHLDRRTDGPGLHRSADGRWAKIAVGAGAPLDAGGGHRHCPAPPAMIRRLRANLLDELQKQYVVTGRAKGLPPGRLLLKYPLRMALNPFIADIGNLLPQLDLRLRSIVSVVMSLPTTGPMLLRGAAEPGHVPRRLVPDVPGGADGGRHVPLRRALAVLDPRIRLHGGVEQVSDTPMPHYVSTRRSTSQDAERLTPEQERYYMARSGG